MASRSSMNISLTTRTRASASPSTRPRATTFTSSTWKLKNAVSFTFPTNITIPPNNVLIVVSFDPTNTAQLNAFQTKYNMSPATPVVGPWNGKLDNGGESIELYKPDAPQPPP